MFPLFRLPLLAIVEVLEIMKLAELLELTHTSRKIASLIKRFQNTELKLAVTIKNEFANIDISTKNDKYCIKILKEQYYHHITEYRMFRNKSFGVYFGIGDVTRVVTYGCVMELTLQICSHLLTNFQCKVEKVGVYARNVDDFDKLLMGDTNLPTESVTEFLNRREM